jgi:AraC-type DNA-binding domain-containing proteins
MEYPYSYMMPHLKELSQQYGGSYSKITSPYTGDVRDYWLIVESFHPLSPGWIRLSAQIEDSWGMEEYAIVGKRRALTHFGIRYIYKGEGYFSNDFHPERIPVKAGDLLCLFPGISHVFVPKAGTKWNELSIDFSGSVFDPWMGVGLLDPEEPVRHLPVPGKGLDYWLKRIHDVVLPMAPRGREINLSDTGRLLELISELCNSWQTPKLSSELNWAEEAKARMQAIPLNEKLDLVKVACDFGIGEQAFRKKFKRLCGVTPTVFHSRYMVERACHLLITSNMSVKAIGYECGFGSQPYFSRRFKQITGISPEQYRIRAET